MPLATALSVAQFAVGCVQRSPYNPGRFPHILQNRRVGTQCPADQTETPYKTKTLPFLSELLVVRAENVKAHLVSHASSVLAFFVLFPGLEGFLIKAQADQEKAAHLTPPSATSRLPLKPCQVPGIDEMVLCGQYEVYEDRHLRIGRKIALNIVVLPALSSTPAPDPLFISAGGPGQAATEGASGYAEFFDERRRDRDIVFVDQRGTGLSNPLGCRLDGKETIQTFLAGQFPADRFRDCRAELERKADLRFYTTHCDGGH